jgi:hypothetical protein
VGHNACGRGLFWALPTRACVGEGEGGALSLLLCCCGGGVYVVLFLGVLKNDATLSRAENRVLRHSTARSLKVCTAFACAAIGGGDLGGSGQGLGAQSKRGVCGWARGEIESTLCWAGGRGEWGEWVGQQRGVRVCVEVKAC